MQFCINPMKKWLGETSHCRLKSQLDTKIELNSTPRALYKCASICVCAPFNLLLSIRTYFHANQADVFTDMPAFPLRHGLTVNNTFHTRCWLLISVT